MTQLDIEPSEYAVHERFMGRALELAEGGRGTVSPNPLVGCVVVQDGRIVGEGFHRRAGEAHAEVVALADAGGASRGATIYVTLEPCNHHGRTPPCTDALIEAGVRRVVIAAMDPNVSVAGGGAARLQAAGIDVVTGVREAEAQRQNEIFRTVHRHRRPFVLYKTAMTLDGKIATRTGQSRWITEEPARNMVQAWRNELDAVAVGVNTVLLDDPLLTTRLDGGRTPLKVVFDSVGRTPPEAKLFDDDPQGVPARVVLFATEKAPASRLAALRERGAQVVVTQAVRGRTDVAEALAALRDLEVTSVLLEGGGTLAWSFFAANAVDRVAWFVGPKLLGGQGASPLGGLGVASMAEAIRLEQLETEAIGDDLLITAYVSQSRAAEPAGGQVTKQASEHGSALETDRASERVSVGSARGDD